MNNKYCIWRKSNEDLFFDLPKKERVNLIMAINNSEVIHFSSKRQNTDEEIFTNFIIDLYNKF